MFGWFKKRNLAAELMDLMVLKFTGEIIIDSEYCCSRNICGCYYPAENTIVLVHDFWPMIKIHELYHGIASGRNDYHNIDDTLLEFRSKVKVNTFDEVYYSSKGLTTTEYDHEWCAAFLSECYQLFIDNGKNSVIDNSVVKVYRKVLANVISDINAYDEMIEAFKSLITG